MAQKEEQETGEMGQKTSQETGGGGGGKLRRPPPPSLPWTVRLKIAALVTAVDAAQRRDGTMNRFLFSLADRHAAATPRPDSAGVRSADITVDSTTGLWARVFSSSPPSPAASSSPPLPVIVYLHGGGFTMLSAASTLMDSLCRRFCREVNAVIVSVNYRLAPEHKFPAAYDDGEAVLRHLAVNGLPTDIAVPIDLTRVFLAGDSAGGNIAHHVATRWSSSSPSPSLRLAGIMLLQPFFGGEERTESELRLDGIGPVVNMRRADWSWRAFLPEGADRNHPVAHVTGGEITEDFPPAMVVVGGYDPLQDWQRRYAAVLRRKGNNSAAAVEVVEFPEAIHSFYAFPELADSGELVKKMKAFMDSNSPAKPNA
uniref:Alpha/beta hydrolase fold-3 domain-containing protein n=1 Tax=Leersia perrieri TaxID=77586 RepID=A0A0D9X248_9ORYZ